MRKKKEEDLKYLIYDTMRKYIADQIEGYIEIIFGREFYEKGMDLSFYYESNCCELTVYVDDKELMDEDGFYDGICELGHMHPEDFLYVITHMDEEIQHIRERLDKYLEYKNSIDK